MSVSPWRIGRVVERDPVLARVRVQFDAADAVLSWWLPIAQARTSADKVYWMPDVDEHVVCLLDEHEESGVVLSAIYADAEGQRPPVSSLGLFQVKFKDGSIIDYDRVTHALRVNLAGATSTVDITAGQTITLNVPAGATVNVGGPGGKRLATEDFVFNHKHPSPSGLTGAPIPGGPPATTPYLTTKGKSE